jgi:hypothetical protein
MIIKESFVEKADYSMDIEECPSLEGSFDNEETPKNLPEV